MSHFPSTVVAYCVNGQSHTLKESIESFIGQMPVYLFASRFDADGMEVDNSPIAQLATGLAVEFVEGEWPAEILHRQGSLQYLSDRGFTHAIIPEANEIIDEKLLSFLVKIAQLRLAERVYVDQVVTEVAVEVGIPQRHKFIQLIMVEIAEVWPNDISANTTRLYLGGKQVYLPSEYGYVEQIVPN